MRTGTIENGASAGLKLAHLAAKAAEGKILAEDLVEIGKRKAQRIVRRGRAGRRLSGRSNAPHQTSSLAVGGDRRRRWRDCGFALRLELFARTEVAAIWN